jgi:hypothetical protein
LKNILAITFWSFKEPLVQSGALPYLHIIAQQLPKNSRIFLFTLEKNSFKISSNEKKKITDELAEYGITLISKKYLHFGILSLLTWPVYILHLLFICIRNRVKFLHSFGTPAGTIGYILSIVTGKKLVIDCFEPHAEAMIETGNWPKNGLAFRMLFLFEKLQTKRSYVILAHSARIINYIKQKYNVTLNKYFIRSNFVDFELFNPISIDQKNLKFKLGIRENEIVCTYSGKIGGIYLENELFEFIETAIEYWSNGFKFILLTDTPHKTIVQLLNKFNISEQRVISLFAPHHEVKNYLSISDFAICPVKPIPTKLYCSPIKTGEYWAMGLPVIIPKNIGDDSDIIEKEHIGAVIPYLNKKEYLIAIKKIDTLIHSGNISDLKEKIIAIARKYRDIKNIENIYRELYLH